MNFKSTHFVCCFITPQWRKHKKVCRCLNLAYSETDLVEMKCNASAEKHEGEKLNSAMQKVTISWLKANIVPSVKVTNLCGNSISTAGL